MNAEQNLIRLMLRDLRNTLLSRESAILIFAVFVLMFNDYHSYNAILNEKYYFLELCVTEGLVLILFPVLFTVFFLKENPVRFGLGVGGAGAWAPYLFVLVILMGIIILGVSQLESFSAFYPIYPYARVDTELFWIYQAIYIFFLFAWEFFFRGFLLFSLEPRFSGFSIVLQMLPFALLHLGKPELEAFSSIAGGLILGVIALRTRSVWPCFLIHAFISFWMDFCVVYIWA